MQVFNENKDELCQNIKLIESDLNKLKDRLIDSIDNKKISENETIITNARHYEELRLTLKEIIKTKEGMNRNISSEFLATNIRQALYHLGCITGEITTDDLLGNIFKNFCIGK